MKRLPDRILPGARDREPGGSLASLATAMLAVHGCGRNGTKLRAYCPPVNRPKVPAPRKAQARPTVHKRPAFSPPAIGPAPTVAGTIYRIPSIRDEVAASRMRRAAVSRD